MKDPIDDIADITHLPPSIVGLVTRVVADKDSEIERLRAALENIKSSMVGQKSPIAAAIVAWCDDGLDLNEQIGDNV